MSTIRLVKMIPVGRCFVTIERDTNPIEPDYSYGVYSSGHPRISTGITHASFMRQARKEAAAQIRKLRKSPHCQGKR
jgi:hypothetical protein